MTEQCGWQGPRGDDCARPAKWLVVRDVAILAAGTPAAFACDVHLGDIVKERAIEWVGCWVDKA